MVTPRVVPVRRGRKHGEGFDRQDYLDLAGAHDNRPVLVIGLPVGVEPGAVMGSRVGKGGPAFFELVVPYAGELASGKEYETEPDALHAEVKASPYVAELAARGLGADELAPLEAIIGRLPEPTFTIGIGLERLTQYLLGQREVASGAAFPIASTSPAFRAFRSPPE